MVTGKQIKEIFDAMQTICYEVSELIKATNDLFIEKKFEPSGGTAVMWDRSNSYLRPEMWLPYFQQRVFIKRKEPSKAVGINIMFDNGKNVIPFISCGLIAGRGNKQVYTSNDFYYAGWHDEENISLIEPGKVLYKSNFPESKVTDYIINYFLPLESIRGLKEVKNLIVDPLIKLYQGKLEDVEQAVKDKAISLDIINGL